MTNRQTARHALPETNQHAGEPRDASLIFRQDFGRLPVFRETVKARGWTGLHLRAPAVQAARETGNAQ